MLGTKHSFLSFPGGTCRLRFLLKSGELFLLKDANEHGPVEFAVVFRKDTGRGNLVTEIRYAASHECRCPMPVGAQCC